MATKTLTDVSTILGGMENSLEEGQRTWNNIVAAQIAEMSKRYSGNSAITNIMASWHKQVTLGYKHTKNFAPHINGFYMIFMVHGTWYQDYISYVQGQNSAGLSNLADEHAYDKNLGPFSFDNPGSHLNMLATDIDIPDITEEFTSVSSRLRNSFVPTRHYFVSDFNISYIENANLNIMRYHEGWHKYLNLIKRGEAGISRGGASADIAQSISSKNCDKNNSGYFLEMPYSNAVWVAVFKPFTTEIQLLVKLMGVMPITMPLKQVIGNRSQSKMTVLNISYKAADIFYKFYNNSKELMQDNGRLASSFKNEVLYASPTKDINESAPNSQANESAYFGKVAKPNTWMGI